MQVGLEFFPGLVVVVVVRVVLVMMVELVVCLLVGLLFFVVLELEGKSGSKTGARHCTQRGCCRGNDLQIANRLSCFLGREAFLIKKF